MTPLFAFFFGTPGPLELVVIALVVLLLFGKRLPGVMGSLGKGIVEFKKGVRGIEDEVEKAAQVEDSGSEEEEPAEKQSS